MILYTFYFCSNPTKWRLFSSLRRSNSANLCKLQCQSTVIFRTATTIRLVWISPRYHLRVRMINNDKGDLRIVDKTYNLTKTTLNHSCRCHCKIFRLTIAFRICRSGTKRIPNTNHLTVFHLGIVLDNIHDADKLIKNLFNRCSPNKSQRISIKTDKLGSFEIELVLSIYKNRNPILPLSRSKSLN